MNEGQRLAAIQLAGHVAIDAVYQPLSQDIEALILRAGPFRASTIPFLLNQLQRSLMNADLALARVIVGTAREAELMADSDGVPDQRAIFLAQLASVASLRRNQPAVLCQTASLLYRGVSKGLSLADTAKTVQQYFSPWFATRRDATGRQVRLGRVGLIKSWPGEAGMASQRVRLLMLTESTAAHSRGMQRRARRENRLICYTLSLKHLERDACDANARRDVGFGPGLYLPDEAPSVPAHWGCRCYFESADKVPFPVEQEAITGLHRGFLIA